MSLILVIVGVLLVGVGVAFAWANKAADKAGGSGLKSISVEGPAWLVLIVVGLASVSFGVVRWEDRNPPKDRDDAQTPVTEPPVDDLDLFPTGFTFGDNNELDRLWRACERSDWSACDELYETSDIGSDYEWFGATCGGLPFNPNPNTEWCDPTRT